MPPVFSGDSSDYLPFRMGTLLFAECVGFGEGFTLLRKVPVGDTSLTTQYIRDLRHSDNEVDLNILTQSRSLAEA